MFNNSKNSHHTTLSHFVVPLKGINQVINTKLQSEALLEIVKKPFLAIEQLEFVLIPTLQKLGSRVPDAYMAVM